MKILYDKEVKYFDEFKIEQIIYESSVNYNLFEREHSDTISEQIKIFTSLESKLPLYRAESFSNQVHFQYANKIPIQRWFPYREGYSTRLVSSFLKELKIYGNVFDPFCGSGTTLLSARHNGLNSFGVDINPISTLISKTANQPYCKSDIDEINELLTIIESLPKTKELIKINFELAYKIFNEEILQSLLYFKEYIDKIENHKVRDLFFVAWLSIIEKVSNIKKEGNGIKYKNRKRTSNGYINILKEDWERQVFPEDKYSFVKLNLIRKINIILDDIKNNYGTCNNSTIVFNDNCINFPEYIKDDFQLTFYSPPYCNCFDYFEIHKVELWLGGFITSKKEFKNLRNKGFRSNTNSLDGKEIKYRNKSLESLIRLFNYEKLWSKQIPNVVRGYFDDTHSLLTSLFNQTEKNGYVGIVVGNSAYTGVIIPTDIIIADIAKSIGFEVKNIFITRHLTTSSQQKILLNPLKEFLRESIILLKK